MNYEEKKKDYYLECYLDHISNLSAEKRERCFQHLLDLLPASTLQRLCEEAGIIKPYVDREMVQELLARLENKPIMDVHGYVSYGQGYYSDERDTDYSLPYEDEDLIKHASEMAMSLYSDGDNALAAKLIFRIFSITFEFTCENEWGGKEECDGFYSFADACAELCLSLSGDVLSRILMAEAISAKNLDYFHAAFASGFLTDRSLYAYCSKYEESKETLRDFLSTLGQPSFGEYNLYMNSLLEVGNMDFIKKYGFERGGRLLCQVMDYLLENHVDMKQELLDYSPSGMYQDREIFEKAIIAYPEEKEFLRKYCHIAYLDLRIVFLAFNLDDENEIRALLMEKKGYSMILSLDEKISLTSLDDRDFLYLAHALFTATMPGSNEPDAIDSLVLEGMRRYRKRINVTEALWQKFYDDALSRLDNSNSLRAAKHYPEFVSQIRSFEGALEIVDKRIAYYFQQQFRSRPRMQLELQKYLDEK